MAKFDFRTLTPKARVTLISELVETLLTIRDADGMRQFLQRLLTDSEIFMLARRLRIAEKLIEGKSYAKIRQDLGVGISTIQSVDNWLEEAVRNYHDLRAEKRFQELIDKKRRQRLEYGDMPDSFRGIRHRYGGAFLLLNLILDKPPSKKRLQRR